MASGGGATTAAAGSGGMDWSKILGALGKAGGSGDSKDGKSGQVMPLPQIQNARPGESQSQVGQPRSPVNLDQLVKMLIDHQNLYEQAALAPGAAVQQRPQGLLGM